MGQAAARKTRRTVKAVTVIHPMNGPGGQPPATQRKKTRSSAMRTQVCNL